jgi:exoribonuclease II
MVKKDVRPFCVPDGIDIEEIIASSLRQKIKKKEKINGFWFYLKLRKHQLQDDDEIDLSRAAILSKINLEWRSMTEKERNRYKSIAK